MPLLFFRLRVHDAMELIRLFTLFACDLFLVTFFTSAFCPALPRVNTHDVHFVGGDENLATLAVSILYHLTSTYAGCSFFSLMSFWEKNGYLPGPQLI